MNVLKIVAWSALSILLASGVRAQDAIDLHAAVHHATPNPADWPATVTLEGVEFKPGSASDANVGVRPIFDRAQMNSRWGDVLVWPNPNDPADGWIQFTIGVCVKPSTVWHCAGLHEFWSDRRGNPRIWTGAPLLTQWSDWVYRNQWGPEMEAYRPQVGDEVAFYLMAGDRRSPHNVGPVLERTNVIRVTLAATGVVATSAPAPPVGTSPPTTTPGSVDLSGIIEQLDTLKGQTAALTTLAQQLEDRVNARAEAYNQLETDLRAAMVDLTARLVVLEQRPVITGCRASLSGIIPISCQLR